MKIALAQINLVIGDFEKNSKTIKSYIQKSIEKNAQLVVFPELTTTVKGAKDLLFNTQYLENAAKIIKEIEPLSTKIAILIGTAEQDEEKLVNCTYLIKEGKSQKVSSANQLSHEDLRYFKAEKLNQKFELDGLTFLSVTGTDTVEETDADFIIRLNSTPFIKNQAIKPEPKTIYVNHTGLAQELVYNGGSFATNDNSDIIACADYLKEELVIFDTQSSSCVSMEPLPIEEQIFKTLSFAFKEFCGISGFKKAVIGLSGGIDSALSAVIMCDALGAQNVLGITMPSKYSTEGSWKDSYELADNLGMKCITVPIKPLFETFINDIQGQHHFDLAEENLQARLRANILMAYSNRENRILVSTGNKSEASMGYCTLYGDTCGGINLICDLYKQEVYAVSKWINRSKEVIPQNILTKAPSAELRPGQKDQDSLPEYEILDEILSRHIEGGQTVEQIAKDFDRELVCSIINKLNNMEYKRNQCTYSIKLSTKSLGERNHPLVNSFKVK